MMNDMEMRALDGFLEKDPVRRTKSMILLYGFMLERITDMNGPMEDPGMNTRIRRAMSEMDACGEGNLLG